jgi:hypothetical protein
MWPAFSSIAHNPLAVMAIQCRHKSTVPQVIALPAHRTAMTCIPVNIHRIEKHFKQKLYD